MTRKLLPLFFFLIGSLTLAAAVQNAYFTIKVGNFKSPQVEDFTPVRALGYVYAERLEDDIYEVYLGRFDNQNQAEQIAEQLKVQGYLGASVEARSVEEGKLVTVVQIATRDLEDRLDWEKFVQAGTLHTILAADKIKLVTGPYKNMEEAKKSLVAARKVGFKDAFIKNVNTVFLHRVTPFEMNGLKQPLIPLAFDNPPTTTNGNSRINTPPVVNTPVTKPAVKATIPSTSTPATSTDAATYVEALNPEILVAKAPSLGVPVVPAIRTNVKRRSVLNLQTVLKGDGFYKGSIDGLYGKGTANSYTKAKDNQRQLQKYALLAPYYEIGAGEENESQLQKAINYLAEDPYTAKQILDKSNAPVARAYLAYLNFINNGPSTLVNNLMNRAIQDAFKGKNKIANPAAPFDHTATYAYNDLNQLLLHLRYVQAANKEETATPCWLFSTHPQEMAAAFLNAPEGSYTIQNCGGFDSWQEVKTLQVIAADFNSDTRLNSSLLSEGAAERTRLFITPKAFSSTEAAELEKWNADLWKNVDNWASRDPMHDQLVSALKISYFQSQILLEDHFMDQGFNVDEAKGLSLATMQSLVDYHLERFQ